MNAYEKQAQTFLDNANAAIEIEFIGHKVNKDWHEKSPRGFYSVTIETPLGCMCFDYWHFVSSLPFYREPTEYDILACLQKYPVGTYEDFCDEFGYMPTQKSRDVYEATCGIWNGVSKIFTPEQIKELRESFS